MAKVVIPTDEQWEVLKDLGLTSGNMIVLIRPDIAKAVDIDGTEPEFATYEFGGDPDVWLDIVTSKDHYVLGEITDRKMGA